MNDLLYIVCPHERNLGWRTLFEAFWFTEYGVEKTIFTCKFVPHVHRDYSRLFLLTSVIVNQSRYWFEPQMTQFLGAHDNWLPLAY